MNVISHRSVLGLALSLASLSFATSAMAATTIDLRTKVTSVTASVNAATASLATDASRVTFWSGYHGQEYYGQEEYVEIGWDRYDNITKAFIYTKASGDTLTLATRVRLAYWDGSEWHDAATDQSGAATVTLSDLDITTNRLRIYLTAEKAPALSHMRILGTEGEYDWTVDYKFPDYPDVMKYDFRQDYPDGYPAPTQMLPENVGAQKIVHHDGGWWAFGYGKNRNEYVTDAAIDSLLNYFEWNFKFFRDEMGWLPDKRAKNGYYSTVYLYGSGLTTDNASNTALGGWQSATYYNGENWPNVLISYYPVACFDKNFTYSKYTNDAGNVIGTVTDQAAQQNACIHEGIHAMLADLDGCKKSVWFHESSDNWLMSEAEQKRTGVTTPSTMGFLSAASLIAPFMPIDCYSGWLQDGSFGGPTAEGVNMYNSSGAQVCTWRNLLGGVQYSEYFPNALAVIVGNSAIPWIWQNCTDYILGSMGKTLGDELMRSFLVEYNARRAMVDVGKWNTAIMNLLDNNWGLTVQQEWSPYNIKVNPWTATCYAKMSLCSGDSATARWWKPEYRTTPGWSAANQIPLHVNATKGEIVKVYFQPLGDNMVCQLAYRTKRGKLYYGQPVSGEGIVGIELKDVPANGVVMCIVCNTDYIYKGEATRKAHYDYRLQMLDNAYQPADPTQKWYYYRRTITDKTFDKSAYTGIDAVEADAPATESARFGFHAAKTVVTPGEAVAITTTAVQSNGLQLRLHDASGRLVYAESIFRSGADFHFPASLGKGLYILEATQGEERATEKIIVSPTPF